MRDAIILRTQRRGTPECRHGVVIFEPDANPAQQVPGRRILVAGERLLREIGRDRHVAGTVGESGGEPQPAGVRCTGQAAQLRQRVGKPFGDCCDRAIRVTVASLL